jgi:large subunit ribosomal protein L53
MLTRYITAVRAKFSPFNGRSGKTARNFLALLPPNARTMMSIDVQMLGQNAVAEPATLALKFSKYISKQPRYL